jgi:hypothetical protein
MLSVPVTVQFPAHSETPPLPLLTIALLETELMDTAVGWVLFWIETATMQ